MPLFQASVLNKYKSSLDDTAVTAAFQRYQVYFLNKEIQANIRESKEEQFQEGFLRELFVNVLGYHINPSPNYNLTTEFKNLKGAKKADGAIIRDGKAIGVIELKSTKTKNLEDVRQQAFDYKANQPHCRYVVTSNFEKLRFYIDNAVDFEEFELFYLSKDRFDLLYLCLAHISVFQGLPEKVRIDSTVEEEEITKRLYADYSEFKNELFANIVELNIPTGTVDDDAKDFKKVFFKKTQKLLDRFLFVFFAEDKGLLEPNIISREVTNWERLQDLDAYSPLYKRYQKLFEHINSGYEQGDYRIFGYNGGLFQADAILDTLKIDDDLLKRHTMKLTAYDFESEVDVNILGHIFEHSLSEIEAINAELDGIAKDKAKSKRKKDGIFYTPKYITQYIVENTLRVLCENKKKELEIGEDDYVFVKGRRKATIKSLLSKLAIYREWLLDLTILDPACGSGAFLNQALDFLINEHQYLDERKARLYGDDTFVFPDVENTILERNIYGVDINEESVEIAKLSLWLRTAKRGRKLSILSNNVKCGNSLISESTVAGPQAFDWRAEFPEVFQSGGFDVIIGNPPYLRVQGLRENFERESLFYEQNFHSATGRFDIYVLFMEKVCDLLSSTGKASLILPHKFMVSSFGSGIRKFLWETKHLESILHFGEAKVFEDATTYTCIVGLSSGNSTVEYCEMTPSDIFKPFRKEQIDYGKLEDRMWNFKGGTIEEVFSKLSQLKTKLEDICQYISQGVVSVGDDLFILKGEIAGGKFRGYSKQNRSEVTLEADLIKPLLVGDNVKRYAPVNHSAYVIYPHKKSGNKTVPLEEDEFQRLFPLGYAYMLPHKQELIKKKIRYKTNPKYWYSLHRSREMALFDGDKIVTPETSLGGNMSIDTQGLYHNTQVYTIKPLQDAGYSIQTILGILNSKLFWFFLKNSGTVLRGGYFRFKTDYIKPFPIPAELKNEGEIAALVGKILELREQAERQILNTINYIKTDLDVQEVNRKMDRWYELSDSEFIGELYKHKKGKLNWKMTKSDEFEWLEFIEKRRRLVYDSLSKIVQIESELDLKVFSAYKLSHVDIQSVIEDTQIRKG